MVVSFALGTKLLSNKELGETCPKHVEMAEYLVDAPGHPGKSRVSAIAICASHTSKTEIIDERDEVKLLTHWWSLVHTILLNKWHLLSMEATSWDLPYLVWRSWRKGVKVPHGVMTWDGHHCRWSPLFVDMTRAASLGSDRRYTVDDLGAMLRAGTHYDPTARDMFETLSNRDRGKAIRWLVNNAQQPLIWAQRMEMFP